MAIPEDKFSFEEKPKRKHDDEYTWQDARKAIGMFIAVLILITVVGSIAQMMFIGERMATYQNIVFADGSDYPQMLDNYMYNLNNPIFRVIIHAVSIGLSVAAFLFVYGIIHFFATKVQRGLGTYRGLIVKANFASIATYMTYAILTTILGLATISQVVDRFEGEAIHTSQASYSDYLELMQFQTGGIWIIMFLTWFPWVIWMSFVVKRNYHISTGKGCLTMFLSNLLLMSLGCGLSLMFGYFAYSTLSV